MESVVEKVSHFFDLFFAPKMGLTSSTRRRRLRPAVEVTETPYEVNTIE